MDEIIWKENKLPADRNPALVYLARLTSENGRRTQAQALRVIAKFVVGDSLRVRLLSYDDFPWHMLRYQHTAAIRAEVAKRYAPATANKILAALRGVLREAWRLGYMSAEDFERACDLGPIHGETVPAGRELSNGEILALMQACGRDHSPAGTRDAAIIGIAYTCGLRRAEIVGLELDDFTANSGKILIRGKGKKQRTAYVINGALDALKDWLSIRGDSAGPLFVPINKGGKLQPGRITTQAVYNMLVKRAEEAEVDTFSPHDLRRTFISDLLDKGADIATVSKMAGHANVTTTARYDRRPEEAKQKAAGLLHLPYRRKNGREG